MNLKNEHEGICKDGNGRWFRRDANTRSHQDEDGGNRGPQGLDRLPQAERTLFHERRSVDQVALVFHHEHLHTAPHEPKQKSQNADDLNGAIKQNRSTVFRIDRAERTVPWQKTATPSAS